MTNVYVGNVSSRTREKDLRYKFEKYGYLTRCELRPQGFAFIEFEDSRDAKDAIRALDGYEMDGRRLSVEYAKSRGGGGGRDSRDSRPSGQDVGTGIRGGAVRGKRDNCIIVKNLAARTGWRELKDWSRGAGSVEYADIWNENGKKYGVVKFDDSKSFRNALSKLDNSKLDGEYVRICEDMGGDPEQGFRSRSPERKRADSRDNSPRRDRSPRRSRSPLREKNDRSPERQKSRDRSRSPLAR